MIWMLWIYFFELRFNGPVNQYVSHAKLSLREKEREEKNGGVGGGSF